MVDRCVLEWKSGNSLGCFGNNLSVWSKFEGISNQLNLLVFHGLRTKIDVKSKESE